MTKLEFNECLKVLEQYYFIKDLKDILTIEYIENEKIAIIVWDFPLDFDKQLDKTYNIQKKISKSQSLNTTYISEYKFKNVEQLMYFYQTFRNHLYKTILPSVDTLENMYTTYIKNIFNKSYFSINNDIWLSNNQQYNNSIKERPIQLINLFDDFDKNVNPFLNNNFDPEKIEKIYDVDVYSENDIKNCAHYTIKNGNVIKKYNRHSNGFLYSQKIINQNDMLYVGHYFNSSKNGEVISIILSIDNQVYTIKYNVTDKNVEFRDKTYVIDDKIINEISNLISMAIENNIDNINIYKK